MFTKPRLAITVALVATGGLTLAAAPEPPPYRPVTSDLMNTVIQPRHIKLFLAGQAGNWEYAEYERHNIGGALARIAAAIPLYKGHDTASMTAAFIAPPLAALQTAIAAKDPALFTAAYRALTTGCNQCHAASAHGMVVMQVPGAGAFPDQAFTPP